MPPHAPRIAAVVVLYNPGDEVISNVASYLEQVEVLYAVDNSERPSPRTAAALGGSPKVRYLPNNANLGVAGALNTGAEKAIAAGFDLLLTMDQDSRAAPDMVELMLECLAGEDMERVGIISPFHLTRGTSPTGPAASSTTSASGWRSGRAAFQQQTNQSWLWKGEVCPLSAATASQTGASASKSARSVMRRIFMVSPASRGPPAAGARPARC